MRHQYHDIECQASRRLRRIYQRFLPPLESRDLHKAESEVVSEVRARGQQRTKNYQPRLLTAVYLSLHPAPMFRHLKRVRR